MKISVYMGGGGMGGRGRGAQMFMTVAVLWTLTPKGIWGMLPENFVHSESTFEVF